MSAGRSGDAHARRPGLIGEAARGTLFLDELDMLTPRAQVALLRFLQDQRYRALGSTVEQRADVRFVAATNAQLEGLVRAGAFRADLYYRVSVFAVNLPPLRERREDIVPRRSTSSRSTRGGRGRRRVMPEAQAALLACEWPGNVRELESAIVPARECQGERIEPGISGCRSGRAGRRRRWRQSRLSGPARTRRRSARCWRRSSGRISPGS